MRNLAIKIFCLLFFVIGGNAEERQSSYPYLSGDTWRFFCDWVLSSESSFDPRFVRSGDTIFVEHGLLYRFFKRVLPKIRARFILITPNAENGSDNPLPGRFHPFVKNRKIAAWFLQNIDSPPSPKLIPIPIGLANRFWKHGDTSIIDQFIEQDKKEEPILAYVNFSIGTNEKKRAPCFAHFAKKTWATQKSEIPFSEYLEDLKQSTFVISPPGNGLDCHRTWEALLMGSYPVVLSSSLNPLYEGLPVLIVKSWDEVTEELLLEKKGEFEQLKWSREVLFADHWFEKVRRIQKQLRQKITFLPFR